MVDDSENVQEKIRNQAEKEHQSIQYIRPSNQYAEDAAIERLEKLEIEAMESKARGIGYPCNNAFNLDGFMHWWKNSAISKMMINNAGDPRNTQTTYLTCHKYEREVLKYFARLFKIDFEDVWGYITSSGTGGNEQGLYLGRERMKVYGKPILYSSEEAHYSIQSLARLLDIEHVVIESYQTGEINYFELEEQILPDRPAIFSLSIGSTFKGAIDSIDNIIKIVKKKKIPATHYHADAALFGGFLPFIENENAPKVNFTTHPFDSIAVSGHKFFGSPVPLGIYMARRSYLEVMQKDYIEYIDGYNTTIPCSRSSLNTLILWWTLSTTSNATFKLEAQLILDNAKYLHEKLIKAKVQSWMSPYSNIVYFTKPSDDTCQRWGLASIMCKFNGPLAHAITMQNVDKSLLDEFINDILNR